MMAQTQYTNSDSQTFSFLHKKASSLELPLVLLHGAGCHQSIWIPLSEYIIDRELFALSLPGRQSSTEKPLSTTQEMADWLHRQLHELGLREYILMGHSMGGAIAMDMYLSTPAHTSIQGLVLAATGARLRVQRQIMTMLRTAAKAGKKVELSELIWQDGTDPNAIQGWMDNPPPMATTFNDWKATHQFDQMEHIHQIDIPTLILAGEDDPLTPVKYATFLHEKIQTSSLSILPNASHMLIAEYAQDVAQSVKFWIQQEM